MQADPYWCDVCGLTFNTEKASYEHDISIEHHRRYAETQGALGRPAIHFCSVCDRGGMGSIASWQSHCAGRAHKNALRTFYQFYALHPESRGHNGRDPSTRDRTTSVHHRFGSDGIRMTTRHTDRSEDTRNRPHAQPARTTIRINNDSAEPRNVSDTSKSAHKKEDTPSSEGGFMLNILETIDDHPRVASVEGESSVKRTAKRTSCSQKQSTPVVKRGRPSTQVGSRSSHQSSRHKTPYESNKPVVQEPIPPSPSFPPNTSNRLSETEDLRRMQEALTISHELEDLKFKQASLEIQLRNIQTTLDSIKNERRTLKLRRACLLSGLANSESDDEAPLNNSQSEGNEANRSQVTTGTDRNSEKQVASVAPVNVSKTGPESSSSLVNLPPSSSLKVPTFSSEQRTVSSLSQTQYPSSGSQNGSPSNRRNERQSESSSSTRVTLPEVETTTNTPPTNPLSPTLSQAHTGSSQPLPATSVGGVDLERLALIRQALRSPDSWRFTFEEVDQMLQRTAAKVAARASATHSDSDPSGETNPKPTASNPAHSSYKVSSVSMKHDPETATNPVAPTEITPTHMVSESDGISTECKKQQILRPSDDSSSFDSSDEDQRSSALASSRTLKVKKSIKRDPAEHEHVAGGLMFTAQSVVSGTDNICSAGSDSTPSTSAYMSPNTVSLEKGKVRFGEFHAFEGGTTAVIYTVLDPSADSIYVGGQNGAVAQFCLKTHNCIKKLLSREASVTQMALEPVKRSLFVGYYDNYFVEWNAQTGSLQCEKFFASRVEAISRLPSSDVPLLFLGMSNGDILRHNVINRATGLLCHHSTETDGSTSSLLPRCAISSLCAVQSGKDLLLIIGGQDRSLILRSATDGQLLRHIHSAPHKAPPQNILPLPLGSLFCSYSERAMRIHDWKSGNSVMTLQTQKITSSSVSEHYLSIGDSEGAVRVYKLMDNGLPNTRPMKVYFASARAAVTSLVSFAEVLIAGSLDGTVTVLWINEPANDYVCLYGPFGHSCGIGFANRADLIKHVLDTHLIFGGKKSLACCWGGGRCRVRFNDAKSVKTISDHLLTHIPD
ncbi:unnamed protein product [Calicophoron daubneyi]|uniref:C2H2-type domain-containing protein n=2 Tax=Calicophoron daubneyi TaxID=300641 RepID=A0AAV2T3R9_CALDB